MGRNACSESLVGKDRGQVGAVARPGRERAWRRLGVFRHGAMLDPSYALQVFREHFARCAGAGDGFVALELVRAIPRYGGDRRRVRRDAYVLVRRREIWERRRR